MSVLDRLDKMVKAGVAYEVALEMARGFEADIEAALLRGALAVAASVRVDEQAERRREADRQRQRVRRHPQTSADSADSLPPSPEAKVFPEPLSKTQTSSPNQTPPFTPLRPTKSRGSRSCPDSWTPSAADIAVAEGEGFSPGEIERELAKMRDYEFRSSHTDWSKTFRTWIRRAAEQKPRLVSRNGQPPSSPKFDAKQANLERALRGAEIALARGPQ